MLKKFINEHRRTFIKFCIVGTLATVLNYSVFYTLFIFVGLNYLISAAAGYILGVLLGFQLNRHFTFDPTDDIYTVSMIKYFIVYTVDLFVALAILHVQVEWFGINPLIANIFMIGIVTIMNYLGTRYLVFDKRFVTKKVNYLVYRFRYLLNYMVIGVASVLLEIIIGNILISLGLILIYATAIGFLIGMVCSYFLNKTLNFKVPKEQNVRTFTLFSLISVFAYFLNLIMIYLVFTSIGLGNYSFSRLMSAALIFLISYSLHRKFTFRDAKQVGIAVYLAEGEDVKAIHEKVQYHTDYIHIDLVDETFKKDCKKIDVEKGFEVKKLWPDLQTMTHIMSKTPKKWIDKVLPFSDVIIIHQEIDENVNKLLKYIRSKKKKAGLCQLIDTPLDTMKPYLRNTDVVQVLGIPKPGFSSQHLSAQALPKLESVNKLKKKYNFEISFDGGVKLTNIHKISAKYIVSGSTVLKARNSITTMNAIRTSSRYFYTSDKELGKFIQDAIYKKLEEIDSLVSGTITGSFVDNFSIESISDIDIIVIVDELTKEKYNSIVAKFESLREIFKVDFDKDLIINPTLGPLKFNQKNSVVLHLMMYDEKSHKDHCLSSPFTCLDWQRSKKYVGKPMSEVYSVKSLEPSDFFSARRSTKDYLKDIRKKQISYREYEFEKGSVSQRIKYKEMKNRDYFEFSYHIMKFIMLNFLKFYKKDNRFRNTEQLVQEYFSIFPNSEEKSFFLKMYSYKKERKFPDWSKDYESKIEKFLTTFQRNFNRIMSESSSLYFIRHQKTKLNKPNVFLGRKDDPSIAPITYNFVNDIDIQKVYASPLKRAIETAEYVREEAYLPEITINHKLIEIDYGSVDGKDLSYLKKKFPSIIKAWDKKLDPRFPQGENNHDVTQRVTDFLDGIQLYEKSAVVTHNVFLRCLLGLILKIPSEDWFKIDIPHITPIKVIKHKNGKYYTDVGADLRRQILKKV